MTRSQSRKRQGRKPPLPDRSRRARLRPGWSRLGAGVATGLLLGLSGCSGPIERDPPAGTQSGIPPAPERPEVIVRPLDEDGPDGAPAVREDSLFVPEPIEPLPAPMRPVNPAVQALMDRAALQADTGQFPQAAATIERALRIAPQDPALWRRLGRYRLDMGDAGQAEQMALRAVRFSRGDAEERQAWQLVALARQAQGNAEGAAQARRMAGL
ncbi:MAG: tetratricopeptide repeat protein [Halothiobacillaceae bacterium]